MCQVYFNCNFPNNKLNYDKLQSCECKVIHPNTAPRYVCCIKCALIELSENCHFHVSIFEQQQNMRASSAFTQSNYSLSILIRMPDMCAIWGKISAVNGNELIIVWV
jgi:hypothetical protein